AFRRGIAAAFVSLSVLGAMGLLASSQAYDFAGSLTHASVSIYLYLAAIVFAAFIALKPLSHTRLFVNGLLVAGTVSAIAGLVGYFAVVPGADDLFVRFERAAGTFKDPNVFGAFLVVPLLFAGHIALTRSWRAALPATVAAAIMLLAILMSFSRGAVLCLAVGGLAYAYLAFVTAPTHRQRLKFALLVAGATFGAIAIVSSALQNPDIGDVFTDRAQLFQSYDEGPEGRFGGQFKAMAAILDHPLGLGALEFAPRLHPEDPHNVYLAMFLNAGWVGGFVYLGLVLATLFLGLRHVLRRTAHQDLFVVAYAAFIGLVAVGLLVDTDHWRHFYIVVAMLWGMMAARQRPAQELKRARSRSRTRGNRIRSRIVKAAAPRRRATIKGPARRRIRNVPPIPRRRRELNPRRPERIAHTA
ncbi:MAG: O-antigen ligase family protein, partial [Pseudomonadota bacterium]